MTPASLTQHVLFGFPFHVDGVKHKHVMDKVPANPIKASRTNQKQSKKRATERSMSRVISAMEKGANNPAKIRELTGMDLKAIRMALAVLIKEKKVSKKRVGVAFVYAVVSA